MQVSQFSEARRCCIYARSEAHLSFRSPTKGCRYEGWRRSWEERWGSLSNATTLKTFGLPSRFSVDLWKNRMLSNCNRKFSRGYSAVTKRTPTTWGISRKVSHINVRSSFTRLGKKLKTLSEPVEVLLMLSFNAVASRSKFRFRVCLFFSHPGASRFQVCLVFSPLGAEPLRFGELSQ